MLGTWGSGLGTRGWGLGAGIGGRERFFGAICRVELKWELTSGYLGLQAIGKLAGLSPLPLTGGKEASGTLCFGFDYDR